MEHIFEWEEFNLLESSDDGHHWYGPFQFTDNSSKEELLKVYASALNGAAYHGGKAFKYPKSDYTKAWKKAESLLKKKFKMSDDDIKTSKDNLSESEDFLNENKGVSGGESDEEILDYFKELEAIQKKDWKDKRIKLNPEYDTISKFSHNGNDTIYIKKLVADYEKKNESVNEASTEDIKEIIKHSSLSGDKKDDNKLNSIIQSIINEYNEEEPETFNNSDKLRFLKICKEVQKENNGNIHKDHIEYIIHNF